MHESNKEPRSRRQALKLSLLALAMVPLAFAAGAARRRGRKSRSAWS